MTEKDKEPKPTKDVTLDGRKIVYPIWREDYAEALILPKTDN